MCINNNDNRVIVASDDEKKKAMEIVVKFLEQIPEYSSNDTMAAYKVQKIVCNVKFRHLELCKLRVSLERVIAKSSTI